MEQKQGNTPFSQPPLLTIIMQIDFNLDQLNIDNIFN